jgi:predicted metal-dependent peptidase
MATLFVDIEAEIIEMILQRKYFYGHLLQQFKRIMVSNDSVIKTAAVSITSDLRPNLYINEAFYKSLSAEQKMAVLEHEILHILNKHLVRVENRNHYVWNLATDLAINQYIKGLPDGAMCVDCNMFIPKDQQGKFPGKCTQCGKKLDPNIDVCQPLDIHKIDIGKKINLPPEKPSETYYDVLWEKMPKIVIQIGTAMTQQKEGDAKGKMGQGEGNGGGERGGQQGEGGEEQQGQGQSQGDDGKGQGTGGNQPRFGSGYVEIDGVKIPTVFDDHAVWETGADNKEMAHEKIKDMVKKAMEKTKERSQGYLPAYLKGLIDACIEHKTLNWKSQLRQFVGYEEFACFTPTRKKLNRRFPLMMGYQVQRKAHMVVAVDSSGSVGDDEFAKFFKEIDLMRSAKVTITLVECDADINSVEEYKKRPTKIKRHGYGGTDFRPVFKFVEDRTYTNGHNETFKLKKPVDGVIYLTDGAGTYPTKVSHPTIWVMTPDHWDHGWNDKLGRKIVMEKDD